MSDGYEYDVAFSFVNEDEPIVREVVVELGSRIKSFFYTDQEKQNAFKDGEMLLSEIYGKKSRAVAIFHRKGWEARPWTRIESTAIRNRAHDEGYEFVKMIKMDDTPRPQWLPRAQFFLGFERWGTNGVAAVLEALVEEQGGAPGEDSELDHAARYAADIAFQKLRDQKLNSEVGVKAADELFQELEEKSNKACKKISEQYADLRLEVKQSSFRTFTITGMNGRLEVIWTCRYANTLSVSNLEYRLSEWDDIEMEWTQRERKGFKVDIDRTGQYVWQSSEPPTKSLDPSTMATLLTSTYLNASRDIQARRNR